MIGEGWSWEPSIEYLRDLLRAFHKSVCMPTGTDQCCSGKAFSIAINIAASTFLLSNTRLPFALSILLSDKQIEAQVLKSI